MKRRIIIDDILRAKNLRKHGFDIAELDIGFFEEAVMLTAKNKRQRAVAMFHGQMITVVFQPLGMEAVVPVSMRPATRKERQGHD